MIRSDDAVIGKCCGSGILRNGESNGQIAVRRFRLNCDEIVHAAHKGDSVVKMVGKGHVTAGAVDQLPVQRLFHPASILIGQRQPEGENIPQRIVRILSRQCKIL